MPKYFYIVIILVFILLAGCSLNNPFDDSIKIGVNIEQSGRYEAYGNSYLNGIQLAVEQFNEKGDIKGKKVKLIIEDNKSNSVLAAKNTKKLAAREEVVAILGSSVTATNLSSVKEVGRREIAYINAAPISMVTIENGRVRPYVYNTGFDEKVQGEALAIFARRKLKTKNAYIYYREGDVYSQELAKSFKYSYQDIGGRVNEATYRDEKDFSNLALSLKSKPSDVLFLPGHFQDGGNIVKILRAKSLPISIIGSDSWDIKGFRDIVGKNNLANIYFSTQAILSKNGHRAQTFIRDYRKKYKMTPDQNAALGYDNMNFLLTTMKNTAVLKADKINKELLNNKIYTGVGGNIAILSEHKNTRQVPILTFSGTQTVLKGIMYPQSK